MAGTLGDDSACTVRALLWALGRQSLVKERLTAFKSKNKKCFLELKLLSAYEQLEKVLFFVDSFEKANTTESMMIERYKSGIYMRILTRGIRQVMQSFVPDLMEPERALLLDPTGISVDSLATAQLMHDTFLLINHITQQISDGKLTGCQLLDVCHKCGLKAEVTSRQKINILSKGLHKQMLKQIRSWVLFGELNDAFSEFFIRKTSPIIDSPVQMPSSYLRSSLDTSTSSDFCFSLEESTSASLPFDKFNRQQLLPDIEQCNYTIDAAFVPSHLPYSLVSKILSLGKFMIQIKNNPSNKIPVNFMTVDLSVYGIDEDQVRCKFKQLEDLPSFHHHMLENVLDFIWCQMNRYMKRVAEEEGDLSTHHRYITDVYLMGRGELFRHFLDEASTLLLNDANKVFSRSLDLALERVAQDLYGTDEVKFLKRFHFTLPPKGTTASGLSTLSLMKLVYKSPWPLPLIYTNSVLETYNSVFIFLLNLKRAHRVLTLAWNDMTAIPHKMLKRSANELHFRLTSLITNLQSYVFVDVIMSETESFSRVLQESDNFEEIQLSHAKFLSNIVMRLFLPTKNQLTDSAVSDGLNKGDDFKTNVIMVHKELTGLFALTHEFLMAVKLLCLDPAGGELKLNELNKKFDSLVVDLISLVKSINEKYCSEHLCTLIMRLDYNNYYTHQYNLLKS